MIRISRYLATALFAWFVLCIFAVLLLFMTTQAFRLAPLFAHNAVPTEQLLAFCLHLIVPVLVFSVTPAFMMAVLAAVAGMVRHGEIEALEAVGISRARVALTPAIIALLLCFLLSWAWLVAVPAAGRELKNRAAQLAGSVLTAQLEPNRLMSPVPGILFHADRTTGAGSYSGVFVSLEGTDATTVQIAARLARFQVETSPARVRFDFRDGDLVRIDASGSLQAVASFQALTVHRSFSREFDDRLNLLPRFQDKSTAELLNSAEGDELKTQWNWELARRLSRPLMFIVLAACAIWLAFFSSPRSRGLGLAIGAGLYLLAHALDRLGEMLMNRGLIDPFPAAFAPPAILSALFVVFYLLRKKRNKPLSGSAV